MQKLKGLQCATVTDINTGYHNISLSLTSQDTTTTSNEFSKFIYNSLLFGMCASVYISQEKVDKLLGEIKGVKTYINDILVLSKDILSNNIEQLRIIYCILLSLGLKVNATRCSFGLKDIT